MGIPIIVAHASTSDKWARCTKVYLDGQEVSNVLCADSKAGFVVVWKKLKPKMLTGVVRIEVEAFPVDEKRRPSFSDLLPPEDWNANPPHYHDCNHIDACGFCRARNTQSQNKDKALDQFVRFMYSHGVEVDRDFEEGDGKEARAWLDCKALEQTLEMRDIEPQDE